MSDKIHTSVRHSVAHIALNRPEVHNAFDDELIAALTTELKRIDSDNAVRHVVLTGHGKTFSAGADLNWMRGMAAASQADNRADALRLAALLRTLNFLSKPVIARVDGSAYGGPGNGQSWRGDTHSRSVFPCD